MGFSVLGAVASAVIFVLQTGGLPGLFALMVVESFGLPPLPSEVILPFAGYLVAEGVFPFYPTLAIAVAGGIVGAFAAYAIGRWWRERIERVGLGPLRLHPRHLAAMDRFFAERGEAAVAIARLIPVVRSYVSYPAGTAEMDPVRFGAFTALGLAPFAAAFLYAGVLLRSHWAAVETVFGWFNYVLLGAIVVVGVYLYLLLTDRLSPGWPLRRGAGPPGIRP